MGSRVAGKPGCYVGNGRIPKSAGNGSGKEEAVPLCRKGTGGCPVLLAIVAVVILIALGHERKLAAASASKLAPLVSGYIPEA